MEYESKFVLRVIWPYTSDGALEFGLFTNGFNENFVSERKMLKC